MRLPLIELARGNTRTDYPRAKSVGQEGSDAVGSGADSLSRSGPVSTHDDYPVGRIRIEERNGILPADAAVYIAKWRQRVATTPSCFERS